MNSITRLTANVFFAIIISVVFADIAYYGFGFIRSSPMNAAIVVFAACFASSLLICELFSVSKESNKIKNKVRKSRLSKIAKRIAIENARYNRRIRNPKLPRTGSGAALDESPNSALGTGAAETTTGAAIRTSASDDSLNVAEPEKSEELKTTADEKNAPADETAGSDAGDDKKKLEDDGKKRDGADEPANAAPDAEDAKSAEPEVNLYIGNLSFSIQNAELEKLLEPYGRTIKINIMHNRKGKKKKAYAYVRMSKSSAEKAASELNNSRFQERAIMVKVSYGG
ncbi:MAG: hypothetical protein IJ523_02565 [Succinivibrionaceae bacterium]|nr:hypothetical protein [Succinivibrionaceae bacterium]